MEEKQRTLLICVFLLILLGISETVFAQDFEVSPTDSGILVLTGTKVLDKEACYTLFMRGIKRIGVAFYGLGVITALLAFFVSITNLGLSGDDAKRRALALKTLFMRAAVLSLFGGMTVTAAFFWNLF